MVAYRVRVVSEPGFKPSPVVTGISKLRAPFVNFIVAVQSGGVRHRALDNSTVQNIQHFPPSLHKRWADGVGSIADIEPARKGENAN